MEDKEKLAVDLFIKYSTSSLEEFQQAMLQAKRLMMQGIHSDRRFNPQKYARYFLTFRILKMPEQVPLPQYNIFQQRIERLHNAALSLEMLEMQLSNLKNKEEPLFFYLEIGGLYALGTGEAEDTIPWYIIDLK